MDALPTPINTESALTEAERRLGGLAGDLRGLREHIASIRADVARNGEPGRPKDLLTIEDVAERLSVGMTTVHQIVRSGQLFSVKIGLSRRIPAAAFDAYLAARGLRDRPTDWAGEPEKSNGSTLLATNTVVPMRGLCYRG